MKLALLIIFGLFFSLAVAAQAEPKHPIDQELDSCLETNHGTMPRAECYSKAFEAWERDVNTIYAKLKQKLPSSERGSLIKSQTSWEHYRDSEFDFIGALYKKKRGTGYTSTRIILRIEVVKARALLLESRLRTVMGE